MKKKKRLLKTPEKTKGTNLKLPEGVSRKNGNEHKPIFSLYNIDSEYCIVHCTPEEKIGFADKMRELSNLTWNQIINSHRHGIGSEKINRNSINRPIPKHITDEVIFLALRFSGKKAMVGFRDCDVFHIVWFDRNYSLYNHGS